MSVRFQKRLRCFLSCVVWTGYFFYMRGDLLVVHGFTVRGHRGSPPELNINVRGTHEGVCPTDVDQMWIAGASMEICSPIAFTNDTVTPDNLTVSECTQ